MCSRIMVYCGNEKSSTETGNVSSRHNTTLEHTKSSRTTREPLQQPDYVILLTSKAGTSQMHVHVNLALV